MKKLLFLIALGGLAYWLVKDRLSGEPDEFIFTESPADDFNGAHEPAGAGPGVS